VEAGYEGHRRRSSGQQVRASGSWSSEGYDQDRHRRSVNAQVQRAPRELDRSPASISPPQVRGAGASGAESRDFIKPRCAPVAHLGMDEAGSRDSNPFKGILYALPLSLVLWWLIALAVRGGLA
jgi:hypothetical protein